MIWVFDSWFGWYYTLWLLREKFPHLDFVFYADTKNVPYWEKSSEEIKKLTFDWIKFLFDKGASIVILACNTASAYAIREWQNTYPDKKVLSVTIPWVEAMLWKWYKNVWILATNATVKSNIYINKFHEIKEFEDLNIKQVWCPSLVEIVENKIIDENYINSEISNYLSSIWANNLDALVLGCTHFPILKSYIEKQFSGDIIDPSNEAVLALQSYFNRHKEIYDKISKNWKLEIYTSWENKF